MVDNEVFNFALENDDYKKIMNRAARNFINSIPEEELNQCKMMGLWNALSKYSAGGKTKFTTYLYHHVRWQCLTYITGDLKHPTLELFEIESHNPFVSLHLDEKLECLPDELKDIVIKKHIWNMTLHEIADEYNCSHETIRRKLSYAMKKLCYYK